MYITHIYKILQIHGQHGGTGFGKTIANFTRFFSNTSQQPINTQSRKFYMN
ncbi:hypothetical protein SLEP1_g14368 [Rubroshorea leprosula]|uniref:Uncharacterized protein n=1 Tax=Rubroshorea leprosula TaxID=152421 RepID=A0AAV5IIT1_9ROSI|nr:hypothetical protein SLEP1_g14368 [Rubroshorea leprosula]